MTTGENLTLLTDLYQLTMAQSYFREQRAGRGHFQPIYSLLPPNRGYFVSAGLAATFWIISKASPSMLAAIDYLALQKLFSDEFLALPRRPPLHRHVWAIPEGRIFFKDEPVLEVTAPIIQAQIVETFIINQVHLQTLDRH